MARMKNTVRKDGRVQSKVYIGDGKYKYVYAANNKELQEKVTDLKTKLPCYGLLLLTVSLPPERSYTQ